MQGTINGLVVDYSRDSLFDSLGVKRLRESYMKEEEQSPQERFAYVSNTFSSNREHAQRLYDYSSRHWLSYLLLNKIKKKEDDYYVFFAYKYC